jgi:hypothetical protein
VVQAPKPAEWRWQAWKPATANGVNCSIGENAIALADAGSGDCGECDIYQNIAKINAKSGTLWDIWDIWRWSPAVEEDHLGGAGGLADFVEGVEEFVAAVVVEFDGDGEVAAAGVAFELDGLLV